MSPDPAPRHGRVGAGQTLPQVVRLLLRRHRAALLAWVLSLLALAAVTAPSYATFYDDPGETAVLVTQMQASQGSTVLYGTLPDPGTIGQLFAWETGTYLTLLAALMAILLAVPMTRGAEDDGTLELVRAAGVPPRVPLYAALAVVTSACLVVGLGTGALLVAQSAAIDGLEAAGGIAFGGMLALEATAWGLVAMIAAQLRGEARGARSWALLALAVGFALRVVADLAPLAGLNWATPLGWRAVTSAYTEDRFWTLAVWALACAGLLTVLIVLHGRREYAAALLRVRARSRRRLRIRSVEGWAWASARGSVLAWTVAVAASAALFGSMSEGLVTTLREDPTLAEMMELMGGGRADPVAEFFSLLGLFQVLLVMVFAIGAVLRWRADERTGRLGTELTAGVRRFRSLLARCLVAAGGSAVMLLLSGVVMGGFGEVLVDEGEPLRWAVTSTAGEWPGVLAAIGLTALLVAVVPRLSGAAWALVALSGFLVMLGGLMSLPGEVIDLALLGHAPEPGGDLVTAPMLLLAAIGVIATAVAAALVGRRDLRFG